jgi:hypothetical protein
MWTGETRVAHGSNEALTSRFDRFDFLANNHLLFWEPNRLDGVFSRELHPCIRGTIVGFPRLCSP